MARLWSDVLPVVGRGGYHLQPGLLVEEEGERPNVRVRIVTLGGLVLHRICDGAMYEEEGAPRWNVVGVTFFKVCLSLEAHGVGEAHQQRL